MGGWGLQRCVHLLEVTRPRVGVEVCRDLVDTWQRVQHHGLPAAPHAQVHDMMCMECARHVHDMHMHMHMCMHMCMCMHMYHSSILATLVTRIHRA